MWAILSILVENKPGILFKVTHLFRSRNFNIDSISVGVTTDPEFSRMTITTYGDEKRIQQIVKQLDKMIDTVEVKQLDEHKTVYRELIVFKIFLRLNLLVQVIAWKSTS
jgi:acetolactate synthase-1/3 small subunit